MYKKWFSVISAITDVRRCDTFHQFYYYLNIFVTRWKSIYHYFINKL